MAGDGELGKMGEGWMEGDTGLQKKQGKLTHTKKFFLKGCTKTCLPAESKNL